MIEINKYKTKPLPKIDQITRHMKCVLEIFFSSSSFKILDSISKCISSSDIIFPDMEWLKFKIKK